LTSASTSRSSHRNASVFGQFPLSHFSTAAAIEDQETTSYTLQRRHGVRNVAIVAHVDHGKTTLVDELLKTASASTAPDAEDSIGEGTSGEGERLMDSGELEKERGITITSKVTRLDYEAANGERTIINVVDTPGHAGEWMVHFCWQMFHLRLVV
jgi:GTP-binding protein